jgi:hypothetical protein
MPTLGGTAASDLLVATTASAIFGLEGCDFLLGSSGDDSISGGQGGDAISTDGGVRGFLDLDITQQGDDTLFRFTSFGGEFGILLLDTDAANLSASAGE